jgi:lipoprotein-anchoring transpeptidase ErfK/SrfK
MKLALRTARLVLGSLLLVLPACAHRSPDVDEFPDYSTAYLGPNGEIIFGPGPRTKTKPAPQEKTKPAPEVTWTWNGDGVSGSPLIRIDLSDQQVTFHKGGTEVGRAPCSTGREGYHTPTGTFRITQKNADHISTLYGDYMDSAGNVVKANVGVNKDKRPPGSRFRGAPMPYFMRVNGAVGMHAGYLPGYPASHGCIRLPKEVARIFFENASMGTPVEIVH